jgi:NAD+ synthetase
MNGGFNPIKDLYKTEVFNLSKKVGVFQSIINRPPSAELREDQKDEDSLPSYDILDPIIKKLMEDKLAPKNDLEKRIAKLLRISEFKRRQSCPGIKISNTAFGKDWRLPITNGYTE